MNSVLNLFDRWVVSLLTVSLCLFIGSQPVVAEPSAAEATDQTAKIEDLDRILSQATSIDQFVNSPELLKEYFEGLKSYYGSDRVNEVSFNKIIEQLKDVIVKFPELGERLFESKDSGKSYQIEMQLKSSGLVIKQDVFTDWLVNYKKQLSATFEEQVRGDSREMAEKLAKEIQEFHQKNAELKKKQRDQAAAEFFSQLVQRSEFKVIAAGAILERLNLESVNDRLLAGDADLVLNEFSQMRRSSDFTVGRFTLPKELQNLIANQLPQLEVPKLQVNKGVPAETELFSVDVITTRRGRVIPVGQSSKTTYLFSPLPRRIHGIFKGMPINECVAGNCQSLDSLTPERWATVALEGSEFYHIEKKLSQTSSSYQGFVQLTPGFIEEEIYAAADLGSPLFAKKMIRPNGDIGLFYDLWLEETSKRLEPQWRGLIISDTNGGDNSGVLPRIRQRPSYLFGSTLPESKRFVLTDNLAKKLSSLGIRNGLASRYSGRMILDATLPQVKNLTILNPNAEAIPAKLTFAEFNARLQKVKGTTKESLMTKMLIKNVSPLSEQERSSLLKMTQEKTFGSSVIAAIYGSDLIPSLSKEEALALKEYGKDLEKIIETKKVDNPHDVETLLNKFTTGKMSVDEVIQSLKSDTETKPKLELALGKTEIALAAARLLQELGFQSPQTDEVYIELLKDYKKFSGDFNWKEKQAADYIEKSSILSKEFKNYILDILIRNTDWSRTDVMSKAIRKIFAIKPMPKETRLALIDAINTNQSYRNQVLISNYFFRTEAVPSDAQRIYLSVIGDKDFEQQGFMDHLLALPEIDHEAVQWIAGKAKKDYRSDRCWDLAQFLFRAKNIKRESIEASFAPLLESGETDRILAARVMASHQIITPKVVSILLDEASRGSGGDRSTWAINESFQLETATIENLIKRLEAGDGGSFIFKVLGVQKTLLPEHEQKLRQIEAKGALGARFWAANTLLSRGQGDQNTIEALLGPVGDWYSWSETMVMSRVKKALQSLPLSGKSALALRRIEAKRPKDFESMRVLLPAQWRELSIPGLSSQDIDVFIRFAKDSPKNMTGDEVLSLARVMVYPDGLYAEEIFKMLRTQAIDAGTQKVLNEGLKNSNVDSRYYSAVLLAQKTSQWDEPMQSILGANYALDEVPIERSWNSKYLKKAITENAKDNSSTSYSAKSKLEKILKQAEILPEHIEELDRISKIKNHPFAGYALEVLEYHLEKTQKPLLDRNGQVIRGVKDQSFWIGEIKSDVRYVDAVEVLQAENLTPENLKAVREILNDKSNSKAQIGAAILLHGFGYWDTEIENVVYQGASKSIQKGNWNLDYLRGLLKEKGISDAIFAAALDDLTKPEVQFQVLDLLGEIKLSKDQWEIIRKGKRDANPVLALMSSLVLIDRKVPDQEARQIVLREGLKILNMDWVKDHVLGEEPDISLLEVIKPQLKSSDEKIRKNAFGLLFVPKKVTPGHIQIWKTLLHSQDEEIRVNAAYALPSEVSSWAKEVNLATAMTTKGWNNDGAFERLESNTGLGPKAQIVLAKAIAKELPQDETMVSRILRNQLSLYPETEAILREAEFNPMIKEILLSKKPMSVTHDVKACRLSLSPSQ